MPETYIQQPSTANLVPAALTNCEHVPGDEGCGAFEVIGAEVIGAEGVGEDVGEGPEAEQN